MFGTMGRRAIESVVGLFAVLGFGCVPLGSKTGWEHTLALVRTAPAQDAAAGLVRAFARARARVVSVLPAPDGESGAPQLPRPNPSTAPVRPVPPRLGPRP